MSDVVTKPQYDVVYGGRNRPAMRRRLCEIAKKHSLLAYSNVIEALKDTNAKLLRSGYNFSNAELRVVNSLGKYSLMLKENKKNYFTSRVFEQLFSNSIVLFDKQWKTYECFWRDFNTFYGSVEDLSRRLDVEYDAGLVAEQHEFARSFDYDAYIENEAKELAKVIS